MTLLRETAEKLVRNSVPTDRVTLTFLLDEEVTPAIFVQKIAMACAKHGALRVGEGVSHDDGDHVWIVQGVE